MTARDVIVSGDASGFVQEIIVGPHRLTAGEPIEVGGEKVHWNSDLTPTPTTQSTDTIKLTKDVEEYTTASATGSIRPSQGREHAR